ncbi:MAG: YciI family protein [Myxococcota bacterium]|nr:YciI family protein [Myxococcota bacterium]
MQYMLLIYNSEKAWETMPEAERTAAFNEYMQFSKDIETSGHMKTGDGNALESVKAATTVRVRDGKVQTTDGPFAETREQLGGYYLIEAKDLDEATQIAARIPDARIGGGGVEIRPIMKFDM